MYSAPSLSTQLLLPHLTLLLPEITFQANKTTSALVRKNWGLGSFISIKQGSWTMVLELRGNILQSLTAVPGEWAGLHDDLT